MPPPSDQESWSPLPRPLESRPPAPSHRCRSPNPYSLRLRSSGPQSPPPSDPGVQARSPSSLRPRSSRVQGPSSSGTQKYELPEDSGWGSGLLKPHGGNLLLIWDTSLLPQFPPPNPAPAGPAHVPPYPGAGRPGHRNPRGGDAEALTWGVLLCSSGCPWRGGGSSSCSLAARTPARPPVPRCTRSRGPGSGAGAGRRPTAEEGPGDPAFHTRAETSEAWPGSLSPPPVSVPGGQAPAPSSLKPRSPGSKPSPPSDQ